MSLYYDYLCILLFPIALLLYPLKNNTTDTFMKKKYVKPKLEVIKIEMNYNIALQSVNKGNNLNTGFNGNGYSDKVINSTDKDISDSWGDNWDNRGSF